MPERSRPRVLITRPEERALALRQELEALGYATMVEPLLTIERLGDMSPLPPGLQGIVLTSANAAPALSDDAKRLPVYTVGNATAAAAREVGCGTVIEGDGDAVELATMITGRCRKEDGGFLHLSGDVVRDEFRQILIEQGFEVSREVVYRALAAGSLSKDLLRAFQHRQIAAALLFSPRTAEILVRLLIDHRLASHVDTVTAICVSEAAARPCRTLDWRNICLSARPNREALLRALEGSIGIC